MNLKEKLQSLLSEDAEKINHYFGSNFWDEYPNEDEDVLDFLTENFYEIDLLWSDNKDIENIVRKTLNAAIQMMERKQKQSLVTVKMSMADYEKVENLLPELFPDVSFFVKEADHNLKNLGLCESAPCVVVFNLDSNEFAELIDKLDDIEVDAFNLLLSDKPSREHPAYQKYLKYGCLYDILFLAERVYETIGTVKYVGKSFGVDSLTDGRIYPVVGVEDGFIRVIDDSGEDYLYSICLPCDMQNPELCGKWEIVDDLTGILEKYLNKGTQYEEK